MFSPMAGLVMLVFAFLLTCANLFSYVLYNRQKSVRQSLWFSRLLMSIVLQVVCNIFAWVVEIIPGCPAAFTAASNLSCFIAANLTWVFFTHYMLDGLDSAWADRFLFIADALFVVTSLLSIVMTPLGMAYFEDYAFAHQLDPANDVSAVYLILVMLVNFLMVFMRRDLDRRRRFSCVLDVALPLTGLIVQMFFPTIPGLVLGNVLAFQVVYGNIYLATAFANSKMESELARQRAELTEQQSALMLSQIKPHFLYNTLTAIASLCDEDPGAAQEMTLDFADYLRGNMDSISSKKPVPFTRELEHTKCYLAIESRRFGDKLKIQYDIQAVDFEIPPLSLQPLVENAVKHGVGMEPEGGTVAISTSKVNGFWLVEVRDNGVGFSVTEYGPDEKRSHTGLSNVRRRLEDQCGATLLIESRKGEGTRVTLRIPDGGDQ